jgi:hypothetical protein
VPRQKTLDIRDIDHTISATFIATTATTASTAATDAGCSEDPETLLIMSFDLVLPL